LVHYHCSAVHQAGLANLKGLWHIFLRHCFAKTAMAGTDDFTEYPSHNHCLRRAKVYMEPHRVLIRLSNISVTLDKRTILSNISWDLRAGENWAIIGSNGAGKTTFLNLVRGDIWPTPGSGTRLYYTNGKSRTSPISFRSQTGVVSPELLDQYKKYNWNIKVSDVICTGFRDTAFLYQNPDGDHRQKALETMILLKIEDLADTRFLNLSLGQAKKVLFARAIVQNPQLLVLDELCVGLDRNSRDAVLTAVQSRAEQGTHILCSSHTHDDLVPAITHVLELHEGRIKALGEKVKMLGENHKTRPSPRETEHSPSFSPSRELLLRVGNADVFLKRTKVLSNINWDIMSGEHWGVVGANGSGKTTLLNLISGDLHPAWGGSVQRLGKIGSRNLWDIRCKISMVSADIQAWHQNAQTGLEVLLSGFWGTIGLHHPYSSEQELTAHQWLSSHGLTHLADRDVRTLSYGQLRILLILRAMIIQPRMLLLDEPLSGLDIRHREKVLDLVEELASGATSLIYVTHTLDEMPRAISHLLELKDGAVRYCGPKSDHSRYRV
jgi:molybdate transport system ATP-binding protein